jgi:very-short-patch-repair endonuclease
MAAVLACGPEALLSHQSAGALWGIVPSTGTRVHVTAPRGRHPQPGIVLHRTRSLHPDDRTLRDAIPVTSIARTLLDLAEVLSPRRLERAFEEADRLELLDMNALRLTAERSHGRRGLKPLATLLARSTPAPHTRSELERRFLDVVRDAGLPQPLVNAMVEGFEVDMLWPDRRLIVELDGYAFHRHRAAFERDNKRRAKLQIAGFVVVPITWLRLDRECAEVVRELRTLLP